MTALPQPNVAHDGFICTYDAWNRLVLVVDAASGRGGVPDISTTPAASGRCRSAWPRASNRVAHYYYSDSWQLLEDAGRGSSPDRQFVWGLRYIDDLVLRDRDTTGDGTLDERLFALQDPNWNVTALSDPTGAVGRALRLLGLWPAQVPRRFCFQLPRPRTT